MPEDFNSWYYCLCDCHHNPHKKHCVPCCQHCVTCGMNVVGDMATHYKDTHPREDALLKDPPLAEVQAEIAEIARIAAERVGRDCPARNNKQPAEEVVDSFRDLTSENSQFGRG